jgi:putative serine protease PepD
VQRPATFDAIISGKNITRPKMGISMSEHQSGVKVDDVTSNSAAAQAGLQRGDIIVAIDGETIKNVASLRYKLYKYEVGDTIKIEYLRNNKKYTTNMRLFE